MTTALIADDEPVMLARIRNALAEVWPELNVVAECRNGVTALEAFHAHKPDVAFLDIRMPGKTGLEVAAEIGDSAHAVFVTAYDEHAIAAFQNGAADYLLKPVRRERLLAALQRAKPLDAVKVESLPRGARRFFSVSERGRLILVPADDVIFIRAEQKYITVVTAAREYLIEDSLTRIDEEFGGRFLRIHRNCLARTDLIESFERDADADGEAQWVVTLRGRPDRLPVSRRQHAEVRALAKRVRE